MERLGGDCGDGSGGCRVAFTDGGSRKTKSLTGEVCVGVYTRFLLLSPYVIISFSFITIMVLLLLHHLVPLMYTGIPLYIYSY